MTDYGVFFLFESLAMYSGYDGGYKASYDAEGTLDEALRTIKKEYPSISYEGYVAYCWSDNRGYRDVCQYEISSETKKTQKISDEICDHIGNVFEETQYKPSTIIAVSFFCGRCDSIQKKDNHSE